MANSLIPKVTTFSAPKEFLANEHLVARPGGITVDETTVATAGDGSRILLAGTCMGQVSASGKFGPYDDSASDGRQIGRGILMYDMDATVDPRNGLLIHGFVLTARITGSDAAFIADVKGSITFLP